MKNRHFFLILVLWLLVCFYLFHVIYSGAKKDAIDDLNARQMILARQAKKSIENHFINMVDFLTEISKSDHIIDLDFNGRQTMDLALRLKSGMITAISRVDATGKIIYAVPYIKEMIGTDISGQPHIRKIMRSHQTIATDVFTSTQGYNAIALHIPVFKGTAFRGTLGVLIDFQFISRFFLEDLKIGDTGYAWIISEKGVELFCPVPGHTGNSVFINCKDFPSIITMANEMVKGNEGITTYTFDMIRDQEARTTQKHAVYMPVRIADTFWSVVIAISEDEILSTLKHFKNKLFLVMALLLAGSAFFSYYVMTVWGIIREKTKRTKAEDSLRQERDLMQRIMETSPAGITRVDADGLIVYANKRAEKILGIHLSESTERMYNDPGWHIKDFEGNPLPGEKLPFAVVKQTTEPVFDFQHAIEKPNGSRCLLSINAMPLFDHTGRFDGIVSSIEDITEKHQTEQKYQVLFNEMIDGFALHEIICDSHKNPVDYRFLAVNPAFERLTGLSGKSLIGHTVLEVMPKTEPYWIEKYGQVALTGRPVFFENYSQELGRYFQVTAFRPTLNQFACIFVDVSERKQAEKEIWDAKERFYKVFNGLPDAILILNSEQPVARIMEANQAALKIFGYTPNEITGQTAAMLHVDADPLKDFQEKLFAANRTEQTLNAFEFRMKHRDGSVFPTEHSIFELKDDTGQRTGWVSIIRDLSERKEMEKRLQQAQKMESIGNLAGGIAHDFNNILFPIVGMSELLIEDLPVGSLEHENAMEILKAGKRGSDLVRQILAFSRQSGHQPIPVRPQQVIKEVVKLTRATTPSYIKIDEDIQPDCGLVMADPTQLHQVAMNIITNAFHAVEVKGGQIAVQLKEIFLRMDELPDGLTHEGRYVLLSVSDTGHGIPPDIMNKIFEPYFTTKAHGKGTGLGLAVSYGIIKGHKGDIRVYSEVGKGTTFNIYLPLMEKDASADRTEAPEQDPSGNEKILLIDDEESIVRLEKQMLERLGYQVTAYSSSVNALNALKENPFLFDLIITDMNMPEMTGLQLAKELTGIRQDMPVILSTGFSERINRETAESLGIRGFLMKPVTRSEIAMMVRKVLDESL